MSNANRDYAIVYDVKNSSLVLSRPLNFYITDKNTSNIFVRLVTRVSVGNGIDQYTDIEQASDYVLTMRVVKPNNEVKSINATQHESENIFQFGLAEDFKDIPGKYICELTISTIVSARQELITSDPFNYEVKRSILSNVGEIIETEDTTVEKLLNDLDATKAELSSQIKEIPKYGMFNTDLGLAKFRICKNPKIVAFGDSITEGAGGLQRFDIWADRVKSYMALKYGLYGKGKAGIENVEGTIPSGWVFEAKGTNHSRYYSNENASNINIESRIKYSYKADIIYSTENDGGTFDVIKVSDNSIISSGNCNGNTSYGNKLTITNTSGNKLEIRPNGKVYIECIVYYGYDGLTDGALFIRNGHGGVGLHDYTYDEINATVTKFNPDLTIMAMLVNDSQEQYFEDYKEKVRYTINEAKKTGDCLILINVQGYSYEDVERRKTWDKYKKFLYAIAIELNCALLDMDSFFGGYPNALKNGFFLDDNIHPSSKGHMAISNLITKVLFPEALGLDIENEIIFSGSHGGFDIVSKDFKLPIQDTKELISVFDNGNGATISLKDIVYNKYFDISMWYNRLEFNSDVQRIQFETPIRINGGAEFLGDFCRIPSSSPSNPYKGEIFVDNDNNKFKYVTNSKQRTSQPIQNGTARPTNPEIGEMFFDITLGKPIWCKQITPNIIWVDAIGSEV